MSHETRYLLRMIDENAGQLGDVNESVFATEAEAEAAQMQLHGSLEFSDDDVEIVPVREVRYGARTDSTWLTDADLAYQVEHNPQTVYVREDGAWSEAVDQ